MLDGHPKCECGGWLRLESAFVASGGELSRSWVCVACEGRTVERWPVPINPSGKVLISGPGRAGTTFLIKLLSLLGVETFFPPSVIAAGPVVPGTRGSGFEVQPEPVVFWQYVSPRVVKGSYWCFGLREFLEQGWLHVEHVFIPVRDLQEVAESRLDVGLYWSVPEGASVSAQRQMCARALGEIVSTCVAFEVSYTIMHFPKLVSDAVYCRSQLLLGLPELEGISSQEFNAVFNQLSDPASIKIGRTPVKEAV